MYITRTLSAPHLLNLNNSFKGNLLNLKIFLFLISQQLRVPAVQGALVHLHGKEEAGHWVERALSRGLGILGPSPISLTKQLCDLGQDTCLYWVSVSSRVNQMCMWVLGMRWGCSRCSSMFPSSSSNVLWLFEPLKSSKNIPAPSTKEWSQRVGGAED